MDKAVKGGIVFGLTTGIITTLGLIVGLYSGTHSKLAILGGIITIAIGGAFSDSLGIQLSEESENMRKKYIRESTISTFLSQFIFSLTFAIPVIVFLLKTAIIISVIWGLLWIGVFSYLISKQRKIKPAKLIIQHMALASLVIIVTNYVGYFIAKIFV
jgi:VIT1/CCC1 family predicted Fe2+/Mn2+ transporter